MAERVGAVPPPGARRTAAVTVARVVARNVRERPDAVAFAEVTAGPQLTWREYDEQSDRVAAALRGFGWERGDRVAFQLPDDAFVHAVMLGIEKAGFVGVGVGARAGSREVDHLVARTGARTLITGAAPLPADDLPHALPLVGPARRED